MSIFQFGVSINRGNNTVTDLLLLGSQKAESTTAINNSKEWQEFCTSCLIRPSSSGKPEEEEQNGGRRGKQGVTKTLQTMSLFEPGIRKESSIRLHGSLYTDWIYLGGNWRARQCKVLCSLLVLKHDVLISKPGNVSEESVPCTSPWKRTYSPRASFGL